MNWTNFIYALFVIPALILEWFALFLIIRYGWKEFK